MFIETEQTPNPNVIKFLPGRAVMDKGVAEFKSADEAQGNRFAENLFTIDGVAGVFYGKNFISVTKTPDVDVDTFKTSVMAMIMDHLTAGYPFYECETPVKDKSAKSKEDNELTRQIKELLEKRVRPMVAMDGGDIVFDRFEDGIVYLQMRGACSGCPSATMTLKSGIENMLRHYVPEVLEVRPVEEY
jgi:Fe-S cluster biogenesis protein NfuA